MDKNEGRSEGDDILVSIVNYQTAKHCIACLQSLVAERKLLPKMLVVVADGASGDDSAAALEAWIAENGHTDWISVLPLQINGGFGWAHNQVILRAFQSDKPPAFIHLLNPDAVIETGAVAALRRVFDRSAHVGCVGSQLLNSQGGLQPAGFRLPIIRSEFARGAHTAALARLLGASSRVIQDGDFVSKIEAVSGASFMVRTAALDEVGLFDEGFFLYFEEFEWMNRFSKQGWTIAHEPASRVHHIGGAATKLSRDQKVLAQCPRPVYWYQSQRRLLYRTLGRCRARLAGLAWFAGYTLVALPRSFLSRNFRAKMIKSEGRDMLRAWIANERFDHRSFVAFPGDRLDQPPAWQARQI